jgi:SET family sugar efflux transporter-like MFS transporter
MAQPTTPIPRLSDLIWQSPLYRNAFISLFISGVAFSSTVPLQTLFFVNLIGASLAIASLYYLTNVAVPITGFFLGRYSDRLPGRLPLMRWCSFATAIGWIAMAFTTQMWMAVIISLLAFSVGASAIALLFAAIRDEMSYRPTGQDNRLMTTIRLAYTGGWIIGPVYGGWFSDLVGLRTLFVVAGGIHLLSILPLLKLAPPRFVSISTLPTRLADQRRAGGMIPLLLFVILCTLALSGNNVKFSFLPIYAEDDLAISASLIGAIIAIQPVFEIVFMVICGYLADRFGAPPVVIGSIVMGIGSYLIFANSESAVALFIAQILGAGLLAAVIGLGIVIAQELYPQGVGLASSLFYSALGLSSTVGGLIGAIGVAQLGLPGVFYVPAILCALTLIGLLAIQPMLRKPA